MIKTYCDWFTGLMVSCHLKEANNNNNNNNNSNNNNNNNNNKEKNILTSLTDMNEDGPSKTGLGTKTASFYIKK